MGTILCFGRPRRVGRERVNVKMSRRSMKFARAIVLCALIAAGGSQIALAEAIIHPTEATANSVWNIRATYTNSNGIWPMGMNPLSPSATAIEGQIDYGGAPSTTGRTIGRVRPPIGVVPTTEEQPFYPRMNRPQGFVGFAAPSVVFPHEASSFQPLGYLSLQMDPATKINGESWSTGDPSAIGRFCRGLAYYEDVLTAGPCPSEDPPDPIVDVQIGQNGMLVPAVIWNREAQSDDETTPNKNEEREASPAVLVTRYSPVWLVGVWLDEAKTVPVQAYIADASTLFKGWPAVNVIVIPECAELESALARFGSNFYVDYYAAGRDYVVTQQYPLPLPYTVYPLSTSIDRTDIPNGFDDGQGLRRPTLDRIKVNPEIFNLDVDTNKNDPQSWDIGTVATLGYATPRDGVPSQNENTRIPGNPLYGIYDTRDLESLGGINYATYYEMYQDGPTQRLAINLTTALPEGSYGTEPGQNTVWIRFIQRATVNSGGASATLQNGNCIRSITGVYREQAPRKVGVDQHLEFTGRNYYAGGFSTGNTTVALSSDPGSSYVWVDCRMQCTVLPNEQRNVVLAEYPLTTIFRQAPDPNAANDSRFAMYRVYGVHLDENGFGTNYFLPYDPPGGRYHPNYGVINLPVVKKPGATWPSTLYLKVRSYAVEKVTTDAKGEGPNLCDPRYGGAYDAKTGLIRLNTSGNRLPVPTPDQSGAITTGQSVYIWYRPLSRTSFTPGHATPGTVMTPVDTEGIKGIEAYPDPAFPDDQSRPNTAYTYSDGGLAVWSQNKLVLSTSAAVPQGTMSIKAWLHLLEPDNDGNGVLWLEKQGVQVPLYYVSGTPQSGAVYRGAVSGGLYMFDMYWGLPNIKQQPSWDWLENLQYFHNTRIYDPRGRPMHFLNLWPKGSGDPETHDMTVNAYIINQGRFEVSAVGTLKAVVHDASPRYGRNQIYRGGARRNLDSLTCYPDTFGASWPQAYDVDPLSVEPIEYANPTFPDDGSSSTQFVFRVRYHNEDGLPPLPWLKEEDDPWWPYTTGASGVVLYLDENGTGDYRPHFMQLERPDLKPGDPDYAKYENVYVYRFLPHNTVGIFGSPELLPFQFGYANPFGTYLFDNHLYKSLGIGVYHYFFACSDDHLKFDSDVGGSSFPFENQWYASGQIEWGEQPPDSIDVLWPVRNSSGLDPSLPRLVSGYPQINRSAKRRYSSDGGATPYDAQLFVDRPVRVPGYYESAGLTYPWLSEYHPRVSCELTMPSADSQGIRYDEKKYGYGRFFGTLDPFYRASNPVHPGTRVSGPDASRAETSGATTKTDNVFRIIWRQIDNKPPVRIQVFINNASERSGTTPGHAYTAYTMSPSDGQTKPYDYRKGVWYEYKTKLPTGPHTYYFEAYDGEHTVRWPTRPDRIVYDLPGQNGYFSDWWVPTESQPSQRGQEGYFDNDYVPGPYVNNPPVLSDPSVTPGTGKTGQRFRYRVKYSDPDGQRVYSAYIYIQINDRGDVRKFSMLPETPFTDPSADHSAEYKAGVYYYLDTGTVGDLALEPGTRRYYFEFTDDWGRQGDVNDLVKGETTRLPAGDGNWRDGPIISANTPPTLSKGSVESQDGTANAGTLWTYRVTYRDLNNDAPTLIKVYIGLLQPDGKTIIWDDGRTMIPDDPSDTNYIDGRSYYYQTRLGGVDAVDPGQPTPDPKQYYYAFEAFDGLNWATYRSSSADEQRSDAAGCMILHDLVPVGDGLHYSFKPLLSQRALAVTPVGGGGAVQIKPDRPGEIVRILGVYLTENLSKDSANPQTYYDPNLDTNVFRVGDSTIKITAPLPNGTEVEITYVAGTKAVRTQSGTVVDGTSVAPSNVADILRVISVKTTTDAVTEYYRPYETVTLNVGSGLPVGATIAWVEYEGYSPVVGPLPIDLPPPAGVIPDAQIWEDYTSFPDPILIDDQKNGWISPIDPLDRATMFMPGRMVYDGLPSSSYVRPDDARSIASVEGVYLNSDLTGLNYIQTQTWKVDPADPTRKTIYRTSQAPFSSSLIDRVQRVYGVYTDPEMKGTNYYNMGTIGGQRVDGLNGYHVTSVSSLSGGPDVSFTGVVPNPGRVEAIIGLYNTLPPPATYAAALAAPNLYSFDEPVVQDNCLPYLEVKPSTPDRIKSVLGVYLTPTLTGTNYYVSADAPPNDYRTGDTYIRPTQRIPVAGSNTHNGTAYVQYVDAVDNQTKVANWPLVVTEVNVREPDPIKQIIGIYDNPELTGTNYYVEQQATEPYTYGEARPVLTAEMPGTVTMAYVKYEHLGFGFGPNNNRIALATAHDFMNPLFLAYFGPNDSPTVTTEGGKQVARLTLSTAVPSAVDTVYVNVRGDSYSCGDTYVKLVEHLYVTDSQGEVTATRVVKPKNPALIGGVLGVYLSEADAMSGDPSKNLYSATENPFNLGDTVIRLSSAVTSPPVGTKNIYIVYVPRKVYVKYSDIRFTHQIRGLSEQPANDYLFGAGSTHFTPDGWDAAVTDHLGVPRKNVAIVSNLGDRANGADRFGDTVSQGIVGVWDNANRDRVNFFDPKAVARYSRDPLHKNLSTATPLGTSRLWARVYQRGDYRIDRWNAEVTFLTPKTGRIQASYFFGTKMPAVIGPNTAPELLAGSAKVTPLYGSRVTQFVYSVTYRDRDGPNGQAPEYVRVYVDGVPYDMTPVSSGTPPYREGAVFTCTLPQGLAGGSHKYHFECSDGAALAWYDANGPHQSLVGGITESIMDINGPWVNDPPQLTGGQANPNPTTGGINPWDSVDYTVVYTDADNDEPYTYDPVRDTSTLDANGNGVLDVIEFSGSPRVWIDSGAVDQSFGGTVAAIEGDPMDAGKKRTIVADGNPGWTPDQFAGKLMQITNGALLGRVYLIQSNTANKLVIATNDLAVDGIVAGGPSASTFMINGLLMSKANPAQQDFTKGVTYKITVPKLAVGDHKFHFTARSREVKPQWLLGQLGVEERVSYSTLVRHPQGTDLPGPKVISTPPQGNVAPVISNSAATSLYVGPRDQMAAVATISQLTPVNASLWAMIRELRGAFINANDFDLNQVNPDGESAASYYDPKTGTFRSGDTTVTLTRALPSAPPVSLVAFGSVSRDSLVEVTPDKPAVIESVSGVYLLSDRGLTGANYFRSADGLTTGTYDGAKITLPRSLPAGTRRVYVAYTLKPGLQWADVPVYLKYFSEKPAGAFKSSDLVTFRINYRDADGDPPNYHDNVQGYVKIVFDDIALSYQMRLLNPPSSGEAVNYTSDVAFTSEPVTLPEGTHKYHFEASDGYYTVRFPTGVLGDPTANDYPVQVNYKPVIVSADVDPPAGQPAATFTLRARYRDQDGGVSTTVPSGLRVYARISRADGTGSEIIKDLNAPPGTKYYATGVDFTASIVPANMTPALGPGSYKVVFEATDPDGEEAVPYPGAGQSPVIFTVRAVGDNTAPVIVSGSVANTVTGKPSGKLNDYFVYRAKYRDADGDAPLASDGRTTDVLTLTIDKGTAGEIKLTMTKAPGAPANPTPQDYINGVDYQTATPVSGKTLGGGPHSFEITASDGISAAVPYTGQGPLLLIPYFENFRLVSAGATNPFTAPAVTTAVVGDRVLIVGSLSFPQTGDVDVVPPGSVDNIAISVTKPDGTQLTLEASATISNWTGRLVVYYAKAQGVDPAFATGTDMTLTASGDWTVRAVWPGSSVWDKASTEGRDAKVSVGGPMRTVAVADPANPDTSTPLVDMITPPKIIGSPDAGLIFGYERAIDMRIVRWDPTIGAYVRYVVQGAFPALRPGDAVWIKPVSSYPADPVSPGYLETGLLALGNPEVGLDYSKNYRLIRTFVKDYTRDSVTRKLDPCTIQLRRGWNMFGNIFFNWKKDAFGNEIVPKQDVGIPFSEVKVRYLNDTKTIAEAAAAGWIRDHAWTYDAVGRRYVPVSATAGGAERVLTAWRGYWIRAFVDCVLVIDPNTAYNGSSASAASEEAAAPLGALLDTPPPIPD